jgi:hypothetical protein
MIFDVGGFLDACREASSLALFATVMSGTNFLIRMPIWPDNHVEVVHFMGGINRNPGHHPERPPHDDTHVINQRPILELQRVQGRYRFA